MLAYFSSSGQGSSPAMPGVPPGVLIKSWHALDGAPNGTYMCPLSSKEIGLVICQCEPRESSSVNTTSILLSGISLPGVNLFL